MMTPLQFPLAAGLGDLLEYIVPILVTVFWLMGQLFGGKPKQKPPAPKVRQVAPPAPPAAPGQGGGPPTLEETLRREVEEFMRRAQGRPPQGPQRENPKPQPAKPRPASRPAAPAAERSDAPRRLVEARRPVVEAAPASSRPSLAPLGGPTVGEHVADTLRGAKELAAHAQTLGADVALADERMEEHLREKFVHNLGALEHRTASAQRRVVRSEAAQQLLDAMSKPGGMRQLIIANEILRRPEDRWSTPRADNV